MDSGGFWLIRDLGPWSAVGDRREMKALAPAEGGLTAMTVADRTEDHQARCVPHLIRLRMLALGESEVPLPSLVAAEVIRATQSILAEAEAAGRECSLMAGIAPGTGIFLDVRLSRLANAASDAIAAAWAGDFGQLRRHLARFDTLTSAIWAVQDVARPRVTAEGRQHAS